VLFGICLWQKRGLPQKPFAFGQERLRAGPKQKEMVAEFERSIEVDVEGFAVTCSDAALRSAIVHGRGGHTFPPPVE
jgi:hypothetical protein